MSTNAFRSPSVEATNEGGAPANQQHVRRFRLRAAVAMALAAAGLALAPMASAFADDSRAHQPGAPGTAPHRQYPAPSGLTPHGTYQNPHKSGSPRGDCAHFVHIYTELGELLGVEPRIGSRVAGGMPTFR